jgi:hypothetical protein
VAWHANVQENESAFVPHDWLKCSRGQSKGSPAQVNRQLIDYGLRGDCLSKIGPQVVPRVFL